MSPKQKDTTKETKRRTKKEVDPDKPKKPMTAYFRFTNDKRAEVKAKNPEFKMTEITQALGEMWKKLTEEEKAPYQEAYEKDKVEYEKQLEEYKKTHPTTKGDPDKPKKPASPYFLFTNEKRAEVKAKNPEMKVTEISKVIGEMWKQASEEEKEKYNKKHEELKAKYEEEMEEYYKDHPEAKKEKKEQRAMLIADIQLPDGQIITYICTHLEVSSAELRLEQVKFIQKKVKRIKNPVFLAGDMNAQPDSPEMEFLRKGWDDLTNRELTYSTMKPSMKIDYIYSRKGNGVKLIETRVGKEKILSDHFPVIADIEMK